MALLSVVYASTSGHTEYVVDTLLAFLRKNAAKLDEKITRAEFAHADDLLVGDVLLLASSTWNAGNVEGQLNPHMDKLLRERAKDIQLNGKKVALIALGDQRYRYKANAMTHLEDFVTSHGGEIIQPTLKILNEPYGQESIVNEWGRQLLSAIQ